MQREVLLTLEWAKIGLYPILAGSATREWPWGRPDKDHPIFTGAKANKLNLLYRFEERMVTPTGSRYPMPKHLNPEHRIEIEKVWIVSPDDSDLSAPDDYDIVRNQKMILYVAWAEPPDPLNRPNATPHWRSRTYYGVTANTWNLRSNEETAHFMGDQAFRAAFFKPKHGAGDVPDP